MVNWTDEQLRAMDERGRSLLVSAAAGSGKTAVLVERVIRRVLDDKAPVDIDRLLIVTFTNAAAGEMRLKIQRAIYERLARSPSDPRLLRQLDRLARARICTIHSFCMSVLREFFHMCGLPQDFKIAEDAQARVLREQALQDTLDGYYDRADDGGFIEVVENFSGGRDDDKLADVLRRMTAVMQSLPDKEDYMWRTLNGLERAAELPVLGTPWGREVYNAALAHMDYLTGLYDGALEAMRDDDALYAAYAPVFSDDLDAMAGMRAALDARDWDGLGALFEAYKPGRLNPARGADEALKERAKAARELFREGVADIGAAFAWSSARIRDEFRRTHALVGALFDVAREFYANFARMKRQRGLLDFSDLEQLTHDLLYEDGAPSAVAHELRARFDEVCIDEYQDVNELQDRIFAAVSRGDNLFMVGDVKQSIYRFRMACPEIFLAKRHGGGEVAPLLLRSNFRSRANVLDAANFIFSQLMSEGLGELSYNDDERLFPGAAYDGGDPPVEVRILPGPDDDTVSKDEAEAEFAARRIRELVQSGAVVRGDNGERPLEYGDVAILLRSTGVRARVYERVLAKQGVPVFYEDAGGLLDTREVRIMLALLEAIDNPLRDIPLIAALRSPVFGFNNELLARVRARREGCFYEALALSDEPACETALLRLEQYRLLARNLPIDSLITELYELTDLPLKMAALPGGTRRAANLRLLEEYARIFERGGLRGLFSFNLFMQRLRDEGADLAAARVDAGSGAVRIMSMHKSKGLEFPVCFVCGLGTQFNLEDIRRSVLVHKELGVGGRLRDAELMADFSTLCRDAIAGRMKREQLSEELRVLYVALTRAKERLVLTMTLPEPGRTLQKLAAAQGGGAPAPAMLMRQNSHAKWLLSALLRHPDGGALRAQGESAPLVNASGRFDIAIVDGAPEMEAELPQAVEPPQDEQPAPADPELALEVARRLNYRYPHEALRSLPAKLTVSELVRGGGSAGFSAETAARPSFLSDMAALTAAESGSAAHAFMQYADLYALRDGRDVRGEAARLVDAGLLTVRQAAAVRPEQIMGFVRSQLFLSFTDPALLRRELPFNILVPAGELYPGIALQAGESIMLQGVADMVYNSADGLTLVDYKTDRVGSPDELLERYSMQLELYARALRDVLGIPVTKRYIYSFYLSKVIDVGTDER